MQFKPSVYLNAFKNFFTVLSFEKKLRSVACCIVAILKTDDVTQKAFVPQQLETTEHILMKFALLQGQRFYFPSLSALKPTLNKSSLSINITKSC